MQTQTLSAPEFPTLRSCYAFIWREHGLRGFYRGTAAALARAFPAK
jgi:hypothetical protein